MAKKKHSAGHGHKHGKHAEQGGGNLSLPKPSQAMHVAPKKDNMASNVGGSAHMNGPAGSMGHEEYIETGADMKAPKKHSDAY